MGRRQTPQELRDLIFRMVAEKRGQRLGRVQRAFAWYSRLAGAQVPIRTGCGLTSDGCCLSLVPYSSSIV